MADILFIDDDQLICKVFKTYFESRRISVDFFNSCDQAWQELRKNPQAHKTAIIDLLMPEGMSGLELLKRIKIDPDTRHLPCIILTNIVGDSVVEQTKNQGAMACFFKDHYTPNALIDEVVRLVPSLLTAAKVG